MNTCDKCERVPTRIEDKCPVYNMDDGRHFTDYRPRCMQNNAISSESKAMNSYEYRMYLQHNAKKLMEKNQTYATNNNECTHCYDLNSDGTMLPEESKFQCNANTCNMYENNANGLGTGRNYNIPTNNPSLKNQDAVSTETFLNFTR